MEIQNWINSGCNYNEGISLYAKLPGHSKNLVRLFLLKDNARNREKLRYELEKHIETKPPESTAPPKAPEKVNLQVNSTSKANAHFYRLNQLPTSLHPLAIKQRTDFQEAISLKLQLNELHPDEEGVALEICLQIEDLFDAIETAQKVLDHYVDHKVVLNLSPRNYKDYSGGQLADARRNKRTSVTKYKKRVQALQEKSLQNLSKNDQNKTEIQLQKAKGNLLKHEMELQQLTELINKK